MQDGVRAFNRMSETTVISAMLLGDDGALDCAEAILGNDGRAFRMKLHELVYDAILSLREGDAPIDPTNIAALVDVEQIGMSKDALHSWLVDFTYIGDTWSMESIEYHANQVRELAELRDVDVRLRRLVMESLTPDADLDNVYSQLEEILEKRGGMHSAEVISVSMAKEMYQQYVADIQKRKVNFGWPSIDAATRGLVPGDVCLIFARTNVGKSALAQSMQLSIWERQSIRSIFFSLEMPVTSVYERMVSMVTGWKESAVEEVFLQKDEDRLVDPQMEVYQEGVFFVEKGGLTLKDISRITRETEDIGVIFLDYMQLLKGLGRTPYERISGIATGLKEMAKELSLAVVCISQLSRKGGDGTIAVTLDMARDSGQIEEATDVILAMHREEDDAFINLTVLKARRGRRGATCELGFHGDTPKIVKITDETGRSSDERLSRQ